MRRLRKEKRSMGHRLIRCRRRRKENWSVLSSAALSFSASAAPRRQTDPSLPYREQAPTQSARKSAAPAPPSKSVAGSTGSGFFFSFSSWPPALEEEAITATADAVLWRKRRGIRGADDDDDEGRMRRPLCSDDEAQRSMVRGESGVFGATDEDEDEKTFFHCFSKLSGATS